MRSFFLSVFAVVLLWVLTTNDVSIWTLVPSLLFVGIFFVLALRQIHRYWKSHHHPPLPSKPLPVDPIPPEEAKPVKRSPGSALKIRKLQAALAVSALLVALLALLATTIFANAKLTVAVTTLLTSILTYFVTEEYWWHSSDKIERRFWGIQAMAFSYSILFIDNHLAFGLEEPLFAYLFVFVSGIVGHSLCAGVSKEYQILWNNVGTSEDCRPSFEEAVSKIREMMNSLDFKVAMWRYFCRVQVIRQEKQLLKHFENLEPHELNYVLQNLDLTRLFLLMKDHLLRDYCRDNVSDELETKHQFRSLLFKLLFEKNLSILSVRSRVALINALQKFGLRAHAHCHKYVYDLVTTLSGHPLLNLRLQIDDHTEYYNFHHLVYADVQAADIRRDIISHIGKHQVTGLNQIKILSDIDDTMLAGGGYPAGCDLSYPKHVPYPGVFAFYKALDVGTEDHHTDSSLNNIGNLVFLSARMHSYRGGSENVSYKKFRELRKRENGLHTNPIILAGDLGSVKSMWGDFSPMAMKKLRNFEEYRCLYPEYKFIFIGDNGQGDAITGQQMCSRGGVGDGDGDGSVIAVFIHLVQPLELTPGYKADVPYHKKIHFFETYVGASVVAMKLGLISRQSLMDVVVAVQRDWKLITWNEAGAFIAPRQSLNNELKQACDILGIPLVVLEEYVPPPKIQSPPTTPIK